ncbi:MAG TPA: hypothetical protein VKS60_20435 [Stellaceae bacterium]|nr:hypothetical protein [Stellaceae bacterium]
MTAKIKHDDKARKVLSADLGVDYARHLKDAQADLARVRGPDGGVKRALEDSAHKTLAARSNAAALIADFEKIGSEIATARFADKNSPVEVDRQESRATDEADALGARYSRDVWDFDDTRKSMKKKK